MILDNLNYNKKLYKKNYIIILIKNYYIYFILFYTDIIEIVI